MAFDFQQLSDVVTLLKKYYEITGRDEFTRQAVISASADKNPSKKVIEFFLNVVDGGRRISEVIKDLALLDSEEIDDISKNLLIWYGADRSNLTRVNEYQTSTGFDGTVNEMVNAEVNTNTTTPEKGSGAVSVIQVLPADVTPATRFADACSLFLTAIPSVEMSRAVPFLDVKLITPRTPLDEKGRPLALSIYTFLEGRNAIGSDKAQSIINADRFIDEETGGDDALLNPRTVSGMELFTSPQALVSGDETFDPSSGVRSAPVIDRFRPLMSIKNIEFNVIPTHGMLSYKSAKLHLVLHDRSRLSEVAELVRPDLYSATELLIEYGWSHPDQTSDNPYGLLIGSMRTREKYGIVNSSFVFGEAGQVDITVELFMKGVTDFSTTKIAESKETSDLVKQVEDLTRAISDIRSNIMQNAAVKEIRPSTILDSTSDVSSALNLSEDVKKTINQYLADSYNPDLDADGQALLDVLRGLYGTDGTDGDDGAVGQLESTLDAVFKRKMNSAKGNGTPDPPLFFLNQFTERYNSYTGEFDDANYVSLSKLFLLFVGEPLAASGRHDEVQILFYPFNAGAGAMRTANIGSFPIDIRDFTLNFQKYIESRGRFNITIGEFVTYITNNFIDDISNPSYGISSNFEFDLSTTFNDNGDREPPEDADDDITMLNSAIAQRMRALGVPDGEFLMPEVSMYVESIPLGTSESAERFVGDDGPSLLKLHIMDKHASPYLALQKLLDAMLDKNLGTFGEPNTGDDVEDPTKQTELAKAVIEEASTATDDGGPGLIEEISPGSNTYRLTENASPKAIKDFVGKNAPTLRYGTSATGIKRAAVRSLQEPLLNTVHMQRAGLGDPTQAPGVDGDIVPMQMLPTELEMETFGCPLMNFGQQLFIDFDTGTTVDNIYGVVGLTHRIEQGKFDSSFKLINIDAYGKFRSAFNAIKSAIDVLEYQLEDEG